MHLVDEIVRRSPDIAVLVTSRERLGITGELTYRVPSLTVPGTSETLTPETVSSYEGVRLFVERAKLVRPDFDLTAENASSVASICARLDGMPLAIELAAPRLRSMSVDELSERLDQRFALLTDGSRAALPRHRTLRSMIDWSYDLLTEREQAMLRRVAVFAGGWTLASAEQVCAGDGIDASDVIEQLTSLVDKSLVVTDEQAGATRYRMLETVRQYALDRLRESGEEARWRGSHLAYFVALGRGVLRERRRTETAVMALPDRSEHDNLRAALAWSAESSPMEGLRLATALTVFWRIRGHLAEGREWLTRLLDACPDRRPDARACTRPVRCRPASRTAGRPCRGEATVAGEPGALPRDRRSEAAPPARSTAWHASRSGRAITRRPRRWCAKSVDCARATGDRRRCSCQPRQLAVALHAARPVGRSARVVRAGTRGGARARSAMGNRIRSERNRAGGMR